MPTAGAILDAATRVANDWMWLAVAWHAGLGALLVALVLGWRPSVQSLGYLLVTPIVSVSLLAWTSGNPFTGTIFAGLALCFVLASHRLPRGAVRLDSPSAIVFGALFIAFGWVYPHFVSAPTWMTYLYATPFGLLPCPTLTALIGVALICGFSRCAPWTIIMATAAALYGSIGVFVLHVDLDYALLAGACVLAASLAFADRSTSTPTPTPLAALTSHRRAVGRSSMAP